MKNEILPTHIGFILDGNRRWAKARNLPTLDGHKKGYETLVKMAYAAQKRGVKFVSAYTFSTENWARSEKEVSYLMELAIWAFGRDMKKLAADNFRIVFMGRGLKKNDKNSKVPLKIREKIAELEKLSAKNSGTTLALCFNYGGHAEILDAAEKIAKNLAKKVRENTDEKIDEIFAKNEEFTEENFAKNLYHPEIPACDLIVRTSGEERISGFQLWRAAYAEFIFREEFWPDFTAENLDECLAEFARRNRRMGK